MRKAAGAAQARNVESRQARRPMSMRDSIARLDHVLRMTEREVLAQAGRVTGGVAQAEAEAEFAVDRERQLAMPSRAEQDFEAAVAQPVKQIDVTRKATLRFGEEEARRRMSLACIARSAGIAERVRTMARWNSASR